MKRLITVAAAALLAAGALGACSTDTGGGNSGGGNNSGGNSGGSSTDTVNVTATAAMTTFVRNWNKFSPADKKSPASAWIYEPLIRINHANAKEPEAWLAKSFEWSADGKSITFKLRDDVKWSDGKPFTSKDVKFTYEVPLKNPDMNTTGATFTSVEAPDPTTVVVKFDEVAYTKIGWFGNSSNSIVPEHIWSKQNLKTWTNPEPIGTGPFTLETFSPQQVKLQWRDDYWGGKSKGVKHVNVKAFSSPESAKAMLLKGELDWSSLSWQDADKQFVAKDPKNNHYYTFPTGGDEGLNFNLTKAPLDDVHVRKALYYAIDPEKLLSLNRTGQSVSNATGYDSKVWSDLVKPEYATPVKADVSKAKAELAQSSYKLENGVLTKGGKSYPLTMRSVVEYSNWSAWGQGLAQQWKEGLDLDVKVIPTPEDKLWSDNYAKGTYDIGLDWQAGGDSAWAGYDGVLNSKWAGGKGKDATTNITGWKDAKTDEILKKWHATNDPAKQKQYAQELQKIVVDNVPFAPLYTAAWFVEVKTSKWSGWPTPEDAYAIPQGGLGPDSILIFKSITPTAGG